MKITIGINQREVKKVQYLLNDRPRAAFDFQKPYDEASNQLINQHCCVRS